MLVLDRRYHTPAQRQFKAQVGRYQILRVDGFFAGVDPCFFFCLSPDSCLLRQVFFGRWSPESGGRAGNGSRCRRDLALAIPAVATLPMMAKAIGGRCWKRSQRMGYLCLGLVAAHVFVLGIRGWLTPQRWPCMLPPISLLAVSAAVFPLIVKLRQLFSGIRKV